MTSDARDREASSPAVRRVERLRSLPVGWAAVLLNGAGIVAAFASAWSGAVDYGTAGFAFGVLLTGTLLGLAGWDLFVTLLAKRHAPYLALPERITLRLPPRVVPILSPAAFLIGVLIGHLIWH